MIPFKIILSNRVNAKLKKLPEEIQARIIAKLTEAEAEPFRFFYRLKGRTDYKIRIGDYRIIAGIKQNERLIEITNLGHRKNIYKD